MFKSVLILNYKICILFLIIFVMDGCQEDIKLVQKVSILNSGTGTLTASLNQVSQSLTSKTQDFEFSPDENKSILFGFECEGQCKKNKNWKFEIELFRGKDQCFYQVTAKSECDCRASSLQLICDDLDCKVEGYLAGAEVEHKQCNF